MCVSSRMLNPTISSIIMAWVYPVASAFVLRLWCGYLQVSLGCFPFSHGTGTLQCLQKEMATYRHWSVSLWRDPDDVSHCRILPPDKTERRRLISATLCGWRRCFVADQLWLMTHTYEKKKIGGVRVWISLSVHSHVVGYVPTRPSAYYTIRYLCLILAEQPYCYHYFNLSVISC